MRPLRQAARARLEWVKENIAAFGGDADNVTLGGQSAGSIDTEANVASPLATGLFQRAIFESVVLDGIALQAAEKTGADFAAAAGCGKGVSLPPADAQPHPGTAGAGLRLRIQRCHGAPLLSGHARLRAARLSHGRYPVSLPALAWRPCRHRPPAECEQQRLSDALIKAWTNFARSGDPNGAGAPNGPAFRPTANKPGVYLSETLPVSETITGQQFAAEHKCDWWTRLPTQ
jgi:carboxylesterase type B